MLYPIATESRMFFSLDGLWDLRVENAQQDFQLGQKIKDGIPVYVPASFNDQITDQEIRNHAGWFHIDRNFHLSHKQLSERLVLRFGSVTHQAQVYVNGQLACQHQGGFLPFEVEINEFVHVGENLLSVRFSNLLDWSTLPIGNLTERIDEEDHTHYHVEENFDFYNYAGIHRPVKLYTTPKTYIKDITAVASFEGADAQIRIQTEIENLQAGQSLNIQIIDQNQAIVAEGQGQDAQLTVEGVQRWQPGAAYLYTIRLQIVEDQELIDSYDLPYGFRSVEVVDNQFLINDQPFYFKGFGKHEDFYVTGRGFNPALNVLDINLCHWMGANSIRTSHYPYSEEMMRLCDQEGIVVIDETPAVGLINGFNFMLSGGAILENTWDKVESFAHHQDVIRDLIQRDKNHACVVMWAIANEPASHETGAYEYFQPLFELARQEDPQKRPLTYVNIMLAGAEIDLVTDLCDVICLNRYHGWYVEHGDLKAAKTALKADIEAWHHHYPDKPIMFTEYGADTVAGLHSVIDEPFTEEYQMRFYQIHSEVFDEFPYVIGEQVWNFADFATRVGVNRVQGNKKGIFNRARQPKLAASYLRSRWLEIPNYDYKE